jgi:L-alanine-DL-glutamate epimerase-like enolase superfamily enzyme
MKITEAVLTEVRGRRAAPFFPPGSRQAQMLDRYPEFNAREPADGTAAAQVELRGIYLEIRTDAGCTGLYGAIDDYQAFLIHRYLRPHLIGRDPLATELLFDQMIRLHRHGRSGMFVAAISAVDCALWDLKGKAWNQPVYRLLGGPTRPGVPAYASMLGFSIEPEAAAKTALEYRDRGFGAQKWFFRHGPADGAAGKAANLALVGALRDSLGPHYPLMFDAFMGWDLAYAMEMVRALEPFNLTWLEEPIPPERIGGLRQIRAAARVPIATGEHVYTRWQVKELLEAGAIDVVQTDPDWTGGISELVKICALASSYGTPVIAHGHSLLPALHVAGAQAAESVPMVEYLIQWQPQKQTFNWARYEPEDGVVTLPDLPGLGLALDEARIEQKVVLEF